MKRKNKTKIVVEEHSIAIGTRVKLHRPNLWAPFEGVVEKHFPDGTYAVRVERMDSSSFPVAARRAEMELI